MKTLSVVSLLTAFAAMFGSVPTAHAFWPRNLDEQARIVIEDFGPETVADLIDDVYAENVTFQDPLEIHTGRQEVLEYLQGVYQTLAIVEGAKVRDITRGYLKRTVVWDITMQFQVPIPLPDGTVQVIPLGEPVKYEGVTVFRFNSAGKIISHRDYFDQTPLFNNAFDSLGLFNAWVNEQLGAILGGGGQP